MTYTRYAIFYVPPPDCAWARFATAWLGWDMQTGQPVDFPDIAGLPLPLAEIAGTAGKYGLHGTLKPPFRLIETASPGDLEAACKALSQRLSPVALGPLRLQRLGRFLALCPAPAAPLSDLAAACVRELDPLRAPASQAETARRSTANLTPRQEMNLRQWGYPHVMDDFRFHITLTGRLPKPALSATQSVLEQYLTPILPPDTILCDLALTGEDSRGQFHLLRRFRLSG